MTMIDHAMEDVAGRFGLGPKAGQLMDELVHLISGSPGGVSGFIDKFRSAGLGSEVTSWLGRTDGAALAGPQVERALGSTALGGIASRLGLGSGVVATAIGYILPKLIGQITPGGVIPAGIPAALSGFLQTTPPESWQRRVEQAVPRAMYADAPHPARPKIPFLNSRPRFRQALEVSDLPVMLGGGVLGMISGEAFSVSPSMQWALIGGGITFGVFVSLVEWTRRSITAAADQAPDFRANGIDQLNRRRAKSRRTRTSARRKL